MYTDNVNRRERLPEIYGNKSFSIGAYSVDKLFEDIEKFVPKQLVKKFTSSKNTTERNIILISEIIPYIDSIAPVGYYFGQHPNDESNFGFWRWGIN